MSKSKKMVGVVVVGVLCGTFGCSSGGFEVAPVQDDAVLTEDTAPNPPNPSETGAPDSGEPGADTGPGSDTATHEVEADTGGQDTALSEVEADTGVEVDTGSPDTEVDSGAFDTGSDGGMDAGESDSGEPDTGPVDTGPPEACSVALRCQSPKQRQVCVDGFWQNHGGRCTEGYDCQEATVACKCQDHARFDLGPHGSGMVTIKDLKTGRWWALREVVSTLPKPLTYEDAAMLCATVVINLVPGAWRLPTVEEFQQVLVQEYPATSCVTASDKGIGMMPDVYWTRDMTTDGRHVTINMKNAAVSDDIPTNEHYVHCIQF